MKSQQKTYPRWLADAKKRTTNTTRGTILCQNFTHSQDDNAQSRPNFDTTSRTHSPKGEGYTMSHKTWTDICTNGFSKPYHYTSRETTHQKGTIDDPAAHHCPKHRNSNLNGHRDYLQTKQFPQSHHTKHHARCGENYPFRH